jgi:hypothetical protein
MLIWPWGTPRLLQIFSVRYWVSVPENTRKEDMGGGGLWLRVLFIRSRVQEVQEFKGSRS